MFTQDLKKNVGPIKYKKIKRNIDKWGNKSKRKEKKRNSEIKKIDPGNPKKINVFIKIVNMQ